MGASKQVTIRIDGESVEIWVAQTGGVTWRAWGEFRGLHIDATGTSQSNAIDRWQEKAHYLSQD